MAKRTTIVPQTLARKKILIVDDHPMMREGLRGVINREPDLIVCGEVETANQAMDAIPKLAEISWMGAGFHFFRVLRDASR